MPSRVVRGELNSSESLSRVSLGAELVFVKLILLADDYGRVDARLRTLQAGCFPMRDEVTEQQIDRWLAELATADEDSVSPVLRYEVDGRPYLQLTGWERHRGGGRRGSKSKYPDPPPSLPRNKESAPRKSDMHPSGVGDERREAGSGACESSEDTNDRLAPRKRAANGSDGVVPEDLEPAEWDRLWRLLWKNRPWLLCEAMEATSSHCSRDWVRLQVQETLSYWRGEGKAKADWVATCANRIYRLDSERWEKLSKGVPVAHLIRDTWPQEAPEVRS